MGWPGCWRRPATPLGNRIRARRWTAQGFAAVPRNRPPGFRVFERRYGRLTLLEADFGALFPSDGPRRFHEQMFDARNSPGGPLPPLPAPSDLTDSQLEDELVGLAAQINAATCRWLELAATHPDMAEVAGLAREGYDQLLRIRTLTGLQRGDDGRYIDPATLTRFQRGQLVNVFDVQRMVQTAVRVHFQLDIRTV